MTSQIGSSIKYIIPNDNILMFLFNTQTGFQYDLIKMRKWFTFRGHTLHSQSVLCVGCTEHPSHRKWTESWDGFIRYLDSIS